MSFEKRIITRGKRASTKQKGAVLSSMAAHINFAHETFESGAGVNTHHQQWEKLSNTLTAMGGAMRNIEQWKQYWRDFQRNVKAKAAEEKRNIEESGINGMLKIRHLDDFERRAISIMTLDVIDGDGVSQEKGFCQLKTLSYQEVLDNSTSQEIKILLQAYQEEPQNPRTQAKPAATNERQRRRPSVNKKLGNMRYPMNGSIIYS